MHDVCGKAVSERKTGTFLLETEADIGLQNVKKGDFVSESGPTTSSTPNKGEETRMRKLEDVMAPQCTISDASFRKLVEKLGLAVEKYLAWNVDLMLANTLYDVRRDQNDEHGTYNGFSLNNMMEMVNVTGDVMKPETHEPMFYSVPNYTFYTKLGHSNKISTI